MTGLPASASALQKTLGAIARLPGVRAAIVATEDDGLAAASVSSVDVDVDALAAFAMALFHRARLAGQAAGYGEANFLALDAERGRVLVAAGGTLAVVVLADGGASVGLVRVAMLHAAGDLA
jgi:predicted regulator of Ras-like GTPase activity (Roadblock/LC7/MglB family)